MNNILLIGGPKSQQGVDRIDDDLVSIIEEQNLYNRSAVVVWPTKNFMQPPADTSELESHLDMHILAMDQLEKQGLMAETPEAIYALGEQVLNDPDVRSEAVIAESISEVVYRLSKLMLAVSGGQNLVVIVDDAPDHALCWTRLVNSWKANDGVSVSHYDTKSRCYGALNSVKTWSLDFTGLKTGSFIAADLMPMGDVDVMGHTLAIDDVWYAETPDALEKNTSVEYPVGDRFGKACAVQVNTDGGYMLVVPKPDKPRNFIVGLKTGGAKPKPVDDAVEARPKQTKAKTDQYMTRKDVAALLKMTERTVDRRIGDGTLKTIKVEGKVLILKSSVDKLLEGS